MKKAISGLFGFLAVTILFVPIFSVTVVPTWRLRFVYEDGQPAASLQVRQSWIDFTHEFFSFGNEDTRFTDDGGNIEFPERTIRISVGQLVLGQIRGLAAGVNPHASYGKNSHVYCVGFKIGCSVVYRGGDELPEQVVLRR